ncbi:hypothetical protein D3C73_185380 [compost metagenome]
MGTLVVRFRKKDAAIESALEKLAETYDKSDITREALRQFLFHSNKYNKNTLVINESSDELDFTNEHEQYELTKAEISNEAIDNILEDVLSEL